MASEVAEYYNEVSAIENRLVILREIIRCHVERLDGIAREQLKPYLEDILQYSREVVQFDNRVTQLQQQITQTKTTIDDEKRAALVCARYALERIERMLARKGDLEDF